MSVFLSVQLYPLIKWLIYQQYTRVVQKTSRTLRNYNGASTLWRKISFCGFVECPVTFFYKFQ